MKELEISINNFTNAPERDFRAMLGGFEKDHGAKIVITAFDWYDAWAEMMKIVLYKHGPVMSQVGSTWMESLESTEGLRTFTSSEINFLGGAAEFYQPAWQSGISTDTGRVTAIPWFLDTYALYYRKDLLSKAGVDEAHAFESLEALAETIRKLHASGEKIPLAMPTVDSSRASLHNIAGWIWTHGGEFVSEDGKQLLLSDPKTRQGMQAYYSLHQYMPPGAQTLSDADCHAAFLDGKAAISLRNPSLLYDAQRHPAFAAYRDTLGVAAMPGVNFVGGSSFVLWNHIRPGDERLALDLLHLLTSPETQTTLFLQNGIIPARLAALKKLEEVPYYAPISKALATGRAFRKFKLWGLVEDRLSSAIGLVWKALFARENPNIEEEIARVLDPLERRLQLTLSDS